MKKITREELKKLFVQFLKDNSALQAYKINLAISIHKAIHHSYPRQDEWFLYTHPFSIPLVEHDLNKGICQQIINYSFYWGGTKQGYRFWRKLNDKWLDKTKNIEIIT